jgi:hypothetical protein
MQVCRGGIKKERLAMAERWWRRGRRAGCVEGMVHRSTAGGDGWDSQAAPKGMNA